MSFKNELYKMFEDNEGGSISCTRVVSWSCAIIGIILLVLHFFGIGTNPEPAYTMIGIGVGAGTIKSVVPYNSDQNTEITITNQKEGNENE